MAYIRKIQVQMLEGDIFRSIKSNNFSPIQLSVARHLKDDPANIEMNQDSIIVWDDAINSYISYRYCSEDTDIVKNFLDQWNDYADGNLIDFCLPPISFCIEEKKN